MMSVSNNTWITRTDQIERAYHGYANRCMTFCVSCYHFTTTATPIVTAALQWAKLIKYSKPSYTLLTDRLVVLLGLQ